jgi:hypothetical protein
LITSVKFSPDGKNLISVGGDGCILVWEIAEHLVEAMQDRLVELYAVAERKKQVADERIHQATGGLPAEGVVGKSVSSSKRPGTSIASSITNSAEKATPTRPSTAGIQQKQQQQQQKPTRRLPAWAARGLKSSTESTSSTSSNGNPQQQPMPPLPPPPQSKWAERVNNQDLQILGKPLVNKEKHKLTLELTTGEATWHAAALPDPPPPQGAHTADKLASTLEESDDVLFMDDPHPKTGHGGHGHRLVDTSDEEDDDEELVEGDLEVVDGEDEEETDRLNQTSSHLNLLEESAEQLESWLEKKVSSFCAQPSFPSSLLILAARGEPS